MREAYKSSGIGTSEPPQISSALLRVHFEPSGKIIGNKVHPAARKNLQHDADKVSPFRAHE